MVTHSTSFITHKCRRYLLVLMYCSYTTALQQTTFNQVVFMQSGISSCCVICHQPEVAQYATCALVFDVSQGHSISGASPVIRSGSKISQCMNMYASKNSLREYIHHSVCVQQAIGSSPSARSKSSFAKSDLGRYSFGPDECNAGTKVASFRMQVNSNYPASFRIHC